MAKEVRYQIMPHIRLLWSVIIIFSGMIILVACGSGGVGTSDTGKKTEITIMAPLHFPSQPHEDLIAEIERLTNVELNVEWVPDGIYTDKMNTALTTNSLKTATFVKHTDYIMVKNAIRSGVFWEIGPYLDDYPNLRNLDKEILQQASVDNKIYGLYTERPSSRQGVIIRKDWLDNLGMDEPTTIDELYEVMRRFTYDDPDGNGQDDTFGLTDRNDLIYGAFKTLGSYFGTPNNWLLQDGELIAEFETQEYIDTMNFMRRLYQEGLINQDFAVTSKQVQRDHLIRGAAGVYIGSMMDAQRLLEGAVKVNDKARFTIVNRIAGPYGFRVWSIPKYNGLYLFSKKSIASEAELRDVLAFFDRSMDADVSNLMRYGFEHRHHVVQDGKVYLPQETYSLRVSEVNALHMLMIADLSNPNLMQVQNYEPLMQIAESLSEDNEQFLVSDPTVSLDSATYDERGAELSKIITDATYNYILGHMDEEGFRAEVERWKASGGDKIKEEYLASYHRSL